MTASQASIKQGLRQCAISKQVCLQGAFVANYPWDGSIDKGTHYSACPDDKTFIHLAKSYAALHSHMNASEEFVGGITNGAAWYPLWGGMQVTSHLLYHARGSLVPSLLGMSSESNGPVARLESADIAKICSSVRLKPAFAACTGPRCRRNSLAESRCNNQASARSHLEQRVV